MHDACSDLSGHGFLNTSYKYSQNGLEARPYERRAPINWQRPLGQPLERLVQGACTHLQTQESQDVSQPVVGGGRWSWRGWNSYGRLPYQPGYRHADQPLHAHVRVHPRPLRVRILPVKEWMWSVRAHSSTIQPNGLRARQCAQSLWRARDRCFVCGSDCGRVAHLPLPVLSSLLGLRLELRLAS